MKRVVLTCVCLLLIGAGCSGTLASKRAGAPAAHVPITNISPLVTTVNWQQTGTGWKPSGTVPDCPIPFQLASPADISSATSVMYPGQSRGGEYKPHGGFRFDTISDNTAVVLSPIDGQVVRGARYLVNGEVQYTFDIIHPCGIMVRLGHLRELTSKFQPIADAFPPAHEGDSRTTTVDPRVSVTTGETIATMIGTTADHNTFFDLGVYDLRQKNSAADDPDYAASHDEELAQHGLCWLTMLPQADDNKIITLPAGDPTSGKTSDYCKE